jgi:hypothetical protein
MKKLQNWILLVFTSSFMSYFLLPWEMTIGVFLAGLVMLSYNLILYSIIDGESYHEEQ